MKLRTLLNLQVLYAAAGTGYNIISIIMKSTAGKGLSATSPLAGIAVLLFYLLFLIPGFKKKMTPYRILMGIAIIVLGYGGVVSHILKYDSMDLYYSHAAWLLAILINLFGLVLNAWAVSGKYAKE